MSNYIARGEMAFHSVGLTELPEKEMMACNFRLFYYDSSKY